MAIKDILVLLDSNSKDNLTQYAVSLAHMFNAHVTAAGISMDMSPPPAFMGEYPYELMVAAGEENQKLIHTIYDKFSGAAQMAGVISELQMIEGLPGRARENFGKMARQFDLTVLEQPNEDKHTGDELMVEAAMFRSGRPVLIVPYIHTGPAKFNKMIVAWDGGLAAARAVADAMPLLKRAGKVDVVTITSRRVKENDMPGFDITKHLARHGINAELKRLPDGEEPGATLLSYAADANADFMVMGGYGHSRLREFVLGGTTRTLLSSMTLPVLMSH